MCVHVSAGINEAGSQGGKGWGSERGEEGEVKEEWGVKTDSNFVKNWTCTQAYIYQTTDVKWLPCSVIKLPSTYSMAVHKIA